MVFTHEVLLEAFNFTKDLQIVVFKDASLVHLLHFLNGILALLVAELIQLILILRGEFNIRHQIHHLFLSLSVDELSCLSFVLLIHLLLVVGRLGSNLVVVVGLAFKFSLFVGDQHQVVQ